MHREPLKSKAGVIQLDKFGKPLYLGQKVIYMKGGMTKGGRGDIGNGIIVGFERYVRIVLEKKMNNTTFIDYITEIINSPEYKKDKRYKWEKEREIGLEYNDYDDISSQYLIGVSDKFMEGWQDGYIRE